VIYQFGAFRLDTVRRRLRRGDELLPLTPKAFDTLAVLLSRSGQVVEKEEILKAVWPDTFVEDATLAQNIATIRRVLGDTAETPAYIATVPRRGYRFLQTVHEAAEATPQPLSAAPPALDNARTAGRTARERLWMMVAAGLALAVGALGISSWRATQTPAAPFAFTISPPDGTTFSTSGAFMTVSPDGRALAFVAVSSNGTDSLWLRSFDTVAARPLPRTDGASQPFWSADSQSIAFFADGRLKRVAIASGHVETICTVPSGAQPLAGTWNSRDDILFASLRHGILRVSSTGGVPTLAVPHDPSGGHEAWPQFLPDGRHFLYEVAAADADRSGIFVGALDSTVTTRLVATSSSAAYSPSGHLVFVRNGQLVAQSVDVDQRRMSGPPRPIAEGIAFNGGSRRANFSLSRNGVLAYRTVSETQLVWFDRAGNTIAPAGPPAGYLQFRIAPDRQAVVAARLDPLVGTSDLWILGPDAHSERRLTFDAGWDRDPIWSPDGTRIRFASDRGLRWQMFEKPSDGEGPDRMVFFVDRNVWPQDWSATRGVLFNEWDHDQQTKSDFWLLRNGVATTPARLPDVEAGAQHGRISPNGRWLAYESYETGTSVYVRPLDSVESRWQIAVSGSEPRWRADGRELFYLSGDLSLMALEVDTGPAFRAKSARRLFQTRAVTPSGMIGGQVYDVSADGQRFLIKTAASLSPITVVVNAFSSLRAR
jgi:DNA-binding winged helix-turn-helix (wHTH) protein/Tol biopolymer transport system component